MRPWLPLALLLPACGGPAFSSAAATSEDPSDSGLTAQTRSDSTADPTVDGSPSGLSGDGSPDAPASIDSADDLPILRDASSDSPEAGEDACVPHDLFNGTTGYSPVQTLSETTPKACRCDYSCACLEAESTFCSIAGASIASCETTGDGLLNITCGS